MMKLYILIFLTILLPLSRYMKPITQDDTPYIVFMSLRNPLDDQTGNADPSRRTGGLYAVQPDGKGEQLIISFADVEAALPAEANDYVSEMSLSPDGTQVAALLALRHKLASGLEDVPVEAVFDPQTMPTALFVMNLTDRSVTQFSGDEDFKSSLAWSPDGTRVAYAQTTIDHDDDTVFVVNLETSETKPISLNSVDLAEMAVALHADDIAAVEDTSIVFSHLNWSPDGQQLAISVQVTPGGAFPGYYTVLMASVDGSQLRPLTHDHTLPLATAAWDADASALILACGLTGDDLCQYDLETAEITPLVSLETIPLQFDWVNGLDVAADGRVAFSAYSLEPANNIWVYDPATDALDLLTLDEAPGTAHDAPRWFEQ